MNRAEQETGGLSNVELYLASFFSNAAILVFEIAGGRLLAPYLGTSVEIWAGLIAVVLGSMALGYRMGGFVADRNASRRMIALAFFMAGGAAFLAWGYRDIIPALFVGSPIPITAGAFILGGILFLPTVVLLAALSPLIAKNLITGLSNSARVVGTLNAVGTLGSILGAVGTGLFLIPTFGIGSIMFGTASALFVFSFIIGRNDTGPKLIAAVGVMLFAVSVANIPTRATAAVGVEETAYNRIMIEDVLVYEKPTRIVSISPAVQCGMRLNADGTLDEETIPFSYLEAFSAVAHAAYPREAPIRALMLGGCNLSYPRIFLREFPAATADVVEIDPGMTEVAKKYFAFVPEDYPSLTVTHQDARIFVNEAQELYDAIFVDVYGSMSTIPAHITTKEMYERLSANLSEDGFVAANIIGAPRGAMAAFTAPFVETMRSVFPHVAVYEFSGFNTTRRQNLIVVASKTREFESGFAAPNGSSVVLTAIQPDESDLILTDDYAPVELLTARR